MGAAVPGKFSVTGTVTVSKPSVLAGGAVVKCILSYIDAHNTEQTPCLACDPDGNGNWCCLFDLAAALPAAMSTVVITAGLFDSADNLKYKDATCPSVTYDPSVTRNPCGDCSNPARAATWGSASICHVGMIGKKKPRECGEDLAAQNPA
jgi:hypothetical protein